MPMAKRRRNPNWSAQERSQLLEEFSKRREVLSSRPGPAVSAAAKQRGWAEVAAALAAGRGPGVEPRSLSEVRKKYENLAAGAKRGAAAAAAVVEVARVATERRAVGGGAGGGEEQMQGAGLLPAGLPRVGDPGGGGPPTLRGVTAGRGGPQELAPRKRSHSPISVRREVVKKDRDFPSLESSRTTADDLMNLKKTVLLLEAQKLKLEIEKLRIEKDNLEMKSVILNKKISKLITSGKL